MVRTFTLSELTNKAREAAVIRASEAFRHLDKFDDRNKLDRAYIAVLKDVLGEARSVTPNDKVYNFTWFYKVMERINILLKRVGRYDDVTVGNRAFEAAANIIFENNTKEIYMKTCGDLYSESTELMIDGLSPEAASRWLEWVEDLMEKILEAFC